MIDFHNSCIFEQRLLGLATYTPPDSSICMPSSAYCSGLSQINDIEVTPAESGFYNLFVMTKRGEIQRTHMKPLSPFGQQYFRCFGGHIYTSGGSDAFPESNSEEALALNVLHFEYRNLSSVYRATV
jgi:hypothetical protein